MKPAIIFIIALIALQITLTEQKSQSKGIVYYRPYRSYYSPSYYYPYRGYYPVSYYNPAYYYRYHKKNQKISAEEKIEKKLEIRDEMVSQIKKAQEILDSKLSSKEQPLKKQVRKLMHRLQKLLR